VLIWFFLGGKREDLANLTATNAALQVDVAKGRAIRSNYERLKAEVAQQEKAIEELIRAMPTDADRGEIPYRIKKLADMAGIEQVSFTLLSPATRDYYIEYPIQFTFRAGYHTMGQFTSLVSGYEKMIGISDLSMKREGGSALYPVTASCRITAYLYNPNPPQQAKGAPKPAAPAAAPKKEQGD
jgi:type IV pilus assembly protein PilO